MKGDFKMKLMPGQTIRELFGVPEERCKELCGLVDTIQESNQHWPIEKVIEVASEHTESENENRFLIAQYFHDNGIHHGIEIGLNVGAQAMQIKGLFERAMAHQGDGGLKVRSAQMN